MLVIIIIKRSGQSTYGGVEAEDRYRMCRWKYNRHPVGTIVLMYIVGPTLVLLFVLILLSFTRVGFQRHSLAVSVLAFVNG